MSRTIYLPVLYCAYWLWATPRDMATRSVQIHEGDELHKMVEDINRNLVNPARKTPPKPSQTEAVQPRTPAVRQRPGAQADI